MSFATTYSTEGFGLANLPYASFSANGTEFVLGVRLGNKAISLKHLAESLPPASSEVASAVSGSNLDPMLAASASVWAEVRTWLQDVLAADDDASNAAIEAAAYDVDAVTYQLAFTPADYVDYYASEHHATNLGKMFRPNEAALKPNWKHLPVGYHGRSGTIVVSGTDVARPKGLRPEENGIPSFGLSRRLDIEAEIGFVLGGSAPAGEVDVRKAADEHIFGVFLFNDWSARDIQNYEYVPLGPYLGKSFASTVGAWVVPWAALEQARVQPPARDVEIAEYLQDGPDQGGYYGLDITMGVTVNGEEVSRPPFGLMYWTAPQMVAHMTVNGASLRPGDVFASGTVSGPQSDQRGSFIELSWGGKEPLNLADGATMTFLEDGLTIGLTGTAPGANGETINFGECLGTIKPAR